MMTLTHARGSAMTYGRRYLLTMAFNISTVDDDGNAATSKPSPHAVDGVSPTERKVGDLGARHLIGLADELGADKRLLCAFLTQKWGTPVAGLADVPSSKYEEVVAQLERKRAANQQKPQLEGARA
jgi:N-methylhydantoinase A/oxoprolinase/acetone carboxylase beta subunit